MNKSTYTDEQINFMRKFGANLSTTELTNALNKTFKTNHSSQSVRTTLKKMGVFKSKRTRSRLCAMQGKPIGSKRIINGYCYIKVRKSSGGFYKDWEREICLVYKKYHGDIPAGFMVVTLDGNKLNADPKNLTTISKSVAARMANGHGKSMWSEFPQLTEMSIETCKLDEIIGKYQKNAKE